MKKTISFSLFFFSATVLLAHPGHPGPADHGDLTHFLLGTLLALPLAAGAWLGFHHFKKRKAARAAAPKEIPHG